MVAIAIRMFKMRRRKTLFNRQTMAILDVVTMSKLRCLICLKHSIFVMLATFYLY